MLSKTHKLTEALTTAIGPVLRENPDYDIIQQAMGLVLARIAQSTPEVGHEFDELEVINTYAKQALEEFLLIEQKRLAQESLVAKGIDGFAELFNDQPDLGLAALNGGMGAEAQVAAEEAQEKAPFKVYPDEYQELIETIRQEEAEQARNDTFREN